MDFRAYRYAVLYLYRCRVDHGHRRPRLYPVRRSTTGPDRQCVVGETPPAALRSWLTPTLLFYIRDYYTVPDIDIADWSLSIDGAVFDPAPP